MAIILKEMQSLSDQVAPFMLLETGFILVWLGLCLWLGGLRWLKFFAGISAAGIGYAIACFFTNRELYFLIGLPVLAAFLAILFEKPMMVLLAGVLIAIIVNLILVWPTLKEPATWQNPPEVTSPATGQEMTVAESLTVLENYVAWIYQNTYDAAKSLGKLNWAVYGVVILMVVGLGFLIPRGICAFLCSMLGVFMLSDGMFFLLLYKGSKPADIVLANPGMFVLVAGGMVVFGILINLAITPAKTRKKQEIQPKTE